MSFISSLKSFMTLPGRLATQTQPMAHPPGTLPGKLADEVNGTSLIEDLKGLFPPTPGALASQLGLEAEAARSIRQAMRPYV